jgi:hypothetical protein
VELAKDWRSDCLGKQNLLVVEICGVLGRLHSSQGLAHSNNSAKLNDSAKHDQTLLETSAKAEESNGGKPWSGKNFSERKKKKRMLPRKGTAWWVPRGQECHEPRAKARRGRQLAQPRVAIKMYSDGFCLRSFPFFSLLSFLFFYFTFTEMCSLRPKKNDVLGFEICPKKNDVLLNLVCVHVHVGMQQSINT